MPHLASVSFQNQVRLLETPELVIKVLRHRTAPLIPPLPARCAGLHCLVCQVQRVPSLQLLSGYNLYSSRRINRDASVCQGFLYTKCAYGMPDSRQQKKIEKSKPLGVGCGRP